MKNKQCPKCKKYKIRSDKVIATTSIMIGLFLLPVGIGLIPLIAGMIFLLSKGKTCESCGYKWK